MLKRINIPNVLTAGNLFCGCLALSQIMEGALVMAALLIGLAAVLDLLDGLVARLLNSTSSIGKELDSLADIVSFGVVPAFIVRELYVVSVESASSSSFYSGAPLLAYIPFLIAIFSGFRLARFNVDPGQGDAFLGLPVPANALFWGAFPIIILKAGGWQWDPAFFLTTPLGFMLAPGFLLFGSLLSAFLLVSNIELFSLKFKHLRWRGNEVRYVFIAMALVVALIFHFKAIPILVILYILLSIAHNTLHSDPT